MESPTRRPQSGGSPLHPLSPRRINQQRMNESSPASMDLSYLQNKTDRPASDVQVKVALLNSLAGNSSPTPSRPQSSTTTAALQRAILGREEAESALKETAEQLTESKTRERRVSERLESLLEELHSINERQSHERKLYEKEVRKARKEAFRAGSAIVKAQEELKYCRAETKALKDELNGEREAKEKAKQDAFERAYTLAGLTEEIEVLKEKVKRNETDNHSETLEARAEVMRGETPRSKLQRLEINTLSCSPASRGKKRDTPDSVDQISPMRKKNACQQTDFRSSLGSPVKSRLNNESTSYDGEQTLRQSANTGYLVQELEDDLQWEKQMRRRAEDMVEFMKMECQFKRCSCRIAEKQGANYIHDAAWDKICPVTEKIQIDDSEQKGPLLLPAEASPSQEAQQTDAPASVEAEDIDKPRVEVEPSEPTVVFCPDTGTFVAIESPAPKKEPLEIENSSPKQPESLENLPQTRELSLPAPGLESTTPLNHPVHEDTDQVQSAASPSGSSLSRTHPIADTAISPAAAIDTQSTAIEQEFIQNEAEHNQMRSTPAAPEIQTVTTTTTVPLLPGTPISREAALAQIRARRGRTQNALKRSASANDAQPRLQNTSTATTPSGVVRSASRTDGSALRAGGGRRGLSSSGGRKY